MAFDEVPVVLFAGIFQDFPVGPESECPYVLPRLCEDLGVSDGHLVVDVLVIGARKPLDYAHLIAMRMADCIDIALVIEMVAFDHERVPFPMPGR